MFVFKVTPFFFMVLLVTANKKIDLQDIEEDNLRSEKENQLEKSGARSQEPNSITATDQQLDYLKNGIYQYFKEPVLESQQQRYVHQYAVTEQPEKSPVQSTSQYGPPVPQHVVGYLPNYPMPIYFVPQYYNEPAEQAVYHSPQPIQQHTLAKASGYQNEPHVQQQPAYIQVPAYVTPTGKTLIQPFTQPVSYVTYAHPTISPIQSTVTPVLAYQMPVVQYPTAISAPPPKGYYQNTQYPEINVVDEDQETEVNIPKPYPSHNDIHASKPSGLGYPRYYNSRNPVTEGYKTGVIELPHPSPLLLKAPPSHLAHIPKVLPMYRPIIKPVYGTGNGFSSNSYATYPSETFGGSFKKRPTSLLDSYIPSSVQLEYMKRGFAKDAQSAYEALSSGRHLSQLSQSQIFPRYYERGFLPNQIYHTANGGITYGHHKRAPKLNKITK